MLKDHTGRTKPKKKNKRERYVSNDGVKLTKKKKGFLNHVFRC